LGLGHIDLPRKGHVLVDAGLQFGFAAVAVRGFVAGDAAQAGLDEPPAQRVQRPGHEIGRRMVVDDRGTAALDRFQRADETAVVERLLVQCPIQPPPQVLQRGDEVRARLDLGHDAARQAGIEVVVRADDAGHDELSVHLAHLGLRVAGCQSGTHLLDQRALDRDVDAALHQRRFELDGGDVLQDQHGAHSPTGLSR
jgi:hypothetical protein